MASQTVTIELEKLEKLFNKVGDLVITNSMMTQSIDNLPHSEDKKNLLDKIALLQRHIVELQDYATDIRMIKFESMKNVYDSILKENISDDKNIKFLMIGNETKLDKSILEHLDLSIKNLIIDAIKNIESQEERELKDKNLEATIKITALQDNGQIHITLENDGKSLEPFELSELDKEIVENKLLNFKEIKQIVEKINGTIEIESEEMEGYSITINVPLTHSILDGLNVKVGSSVFIIPTISIVESIQAKSDVIKYVGDGSSPLLMLRDEFIPIIKLYEFLNITPKYTKLEEGILIVVKSGKQKAAFFIDEFLQQQQVVVKAIETNYKKIQNISGATVKGDGSIGIILDIKNIIENSMA